MTNAHPAGLVRQLLEQRDGLFGFILALTRDREAAEEIFQEVGLAVETKVLELALDPKSGTLLQAEVDTEDRSRVAASVTMTLQAVVDKVLESIPGRAVQVEFELKSGRLVAEIKILGPDGLKEYKADAATGQILSSESK